MPRVRPFRYQTLLRVRKRQEDLKAQSLADVRRRIRAAREQRADIVRLQVDMLTEASQRASRRFDAATVHQYYQYERHLARMAVETDAQLEHLRAIESERVAELQAAIVKRRTIERLEERQEEAFAKQQAKDEQKSLDEISVNHAAIERRSGGKS